jgi:F-type H+-transporting ATPase subunit delta
MAEAITIARPYANALFDIALEKNELKEWSDLLSVLAQVCSQAEVQSIITNPAIDDEQVITLFADIAGDLMTPDVRHFLALLAENKRMLVLTDIAVIFKELREEAEKTMTAEVVSARELTAEQADKISAALKQRLGRDVTLNTSVDETLLGGAIVRAGDLIIDGSALGKLNRLASAIS